MGTKELEKDRREQDIRRVRVTGNRTISIKNICFSVYCGFTVLSMIDITFWQLIIGLSDISLVIGSIISLFIIQFIHWTQEHNNPEYKKLCKQLSTRCCPDNSCMKSMINMCVHLKYTK